MRKKLCKSIAASLIAALAFTSMPMSAQAAKTKISVSNAVLSKGDNINLNIIGAKELSGTYASSKKKIASVSKKGIVTAKKKGKAVITWTKEGKKYTCTIKVVKEPTVSKSTLTLKEEQTKKLSILRYGNKKLSVKWSSSNPDVAVVNNGSVTGVSEGNAVIKAKIKGEKKTWTKKVSVTVKKKEEETKDDNKEDNKPNNPADNNPAGTDNTDTIVPTTGSSVNTEENKKPTSNTTTSSGNNGGTGTNNPNTPNNPDTPTKPDLYEGYKLVWQDLFDGDSLNRDDWNVELHDKGWVNEELQSYVDSEENIYIKDGKLVLKPIETIDKDGMKSYTSGRVNTQKKHDFKYGLFEARAKVPKGQGFLPAFWMMPTEENLYGQWPRCGEIDIMEVLGNKTDTSYGTIHYGNPHSESQGSYTLEKGSFSEEYHTFQVEWEPGKIKWYVDGNLIHSEDDWYSATEDQGEITYPAPFDQPFYIILNLAVGGSWPGNPDETTNIKDAAYEIDYVKVYQKDSYNENVKKPIKEVTLRDPDKNGNYINNGDFSSAEKLDDDKDWIFLTAAGGEASAEIKDHAISIHTTKAGTENHSVQLVQPALPMKRGGVYTVSFDAYAAEARTMIADISAPDKGYRRYWNDTTINLTTEKKTYGYKFTMEDKDDANGRLEFNLGKTDSTAQVWISNVVIKKTDEKDLDTNQEKTVLADGNYIYNGSFQEGDARLGYWNIQDAGADVSVTNENNIRKLKIVAPETVSEQNPVVISQDDLALTDGEYAMSFLAEGKSGTSIQVTVAGQEFSAELTGKEETYRYKLSIPAKTARLDNKRVAFQMNQPGTYYIDNIRLEEDKLIKNGSFNAGFAGYEFYVDGGADATHIVDSLTEDNAADFTILNTGDEAWKIQLKQNNIELEKGQWYKLSLDAKSDRARKIMFAIQRDGTNDDDWTPYSGEKVIELGEDYETYTIEFQMKNETDLKSILSISMGAVDKVQISEKHRICIDNISLEKIDAPEIPEQPIGENMLKNSDFSKGVEGWENAVTSPGEAEVSFENKKASYKITNVGDQDWNVQLKQSGITLEKGSSYKVTFKAASTEARTIKLGMLTASYDWYGGADIELKKDEEKPVDISFTVAEDKETDTDITMVVSMGKIADVETPASTITLSDFSLVKVEQ